MLPMLDEEVKERQQAELDFVTAAYSPEEAWISYQPIIKVHRLLHLPFQEVRDEESTPSSSSSISIKLEISMPQYYPVKESLSIGAFLTSSASGNTFWTKIAIDAIPNLLNKLRSVAIESTGQEAIFVVLSTVEEWIDVEWKEIVSSAQSATGHGLEGNENETVHNHLPERKQSDKVVLARKLIYSHHIIAKTKRKAIADLSRDYQLGGYAKIGWPGIIIIEGEESNCDRFIGEIRSMRWQHLVVRGEEIVPIDDDQSLDDFRSFSLKIEELAEDQMSYLAESCRKVGLEALFKTSMKIYGKEEGQETDEKHRSKGNASSEEQVYGTMIHVDHMRDRKGYEKWIQKACKSTDCFELIIRCYKNDNSTSSRPRIFVAIFGPESAVKQVMKRWRTSRVDVDSKGTPCLERMMTVVLEGNVVEANDLQETLEDAKGYKLGDDRYLNLKDAQEILFSIGGSDWREAMLSYFS